MKKAEKWISIIAMFLVILVLLITSFKLAVYGDPEYKFYEKLYSKYNVTDSLNMEMDDVMEVTDYMMSYLIGEEEELSIVTYVDGREQDFFNEQDRLHMFDVKNLFLGGLRLRNIWLGMAVVLIGILVIRKAELRKLIPRAYNIAFRVFLGIVGFLTAAFSIDFFACFTIFHEIFFTNDLWLFDPRTDYMIRMLTSGFFKDMIIRIALYFVGALSIVFVLLQAWKRTDKQS